jgi:hypothetical protein
MGAAGRGAAVVRAGRYAYTYRGLSSTRDDVWHDVSTAGGVWRCTCEAGLARRPACWHRAAVHIYLVEQGGGRVTGPVTRAPGAAAPVPSNVIPLRRAA